MRITILDIDPQDERKLGYMQLPSFPVAFSSAVFSGSARFVPAENKLESYIGQSLDVEINQEMITDFQVVPSSSSHESVVPTPQHGTFHVDGVISSVVPISEPKGECIITATAGDALFTLTGSAIPTNRPVVGEAVSFTAHDVSFWDEAI